MAFVGKKYKKVDLTNLEQNMSALNLHEKFQAYLLAPDTLTSFTKNDDDTISIKTELGDEVLINDTYPIGKEFEYKMPNGKEMKLKVWFEGEVLIQTLITPSGRVITLERTFNGDKLTLTISVTGVDAKGSVEYAAV